MRPLAFPSPQFTSTSGVPLVDIEKVVGDVNPGSQFFKFAQLIGKQPSLKKAIVKFDRSEYDLVTTELCQAKNESPPHEVVKAFSDWFDESGPLSELRNEYKSYKFGRANLVVRHLLAHFLAFQQDKQSRPEFCCWPGAWLAGDRLTNEGVSLFEKHGALFGDKKTGSSVFPRIRPGRSEEILHNTFNDFYSSWVVCDLVNQWIFSSGLLRHRQKKKRRLIVNDSSSLRFHLN